MAKFKFPVFPMAEEIVTSEDIQAGLLEDLAKLTGIPFGELMASEGEPSVQEPVFTERDLQDVEGEDTIAEPLDLSNDEGDDFGDYLDDMVDTYDVDIAEDDSYGETEV